MKFILILFLLCSSLSAQEFDKLTPANGRTYNKVVVVKRDDAYVSIRHEAGLARILLSDLDATTLKVLGGYDPKKAKIFIDKEKQLTKEEIAARNRGINPRPEVKKVDPVTVPPKQEDKPARLKLDVKPLQSGKLEKSSGLR